MHTEDMFQIFSFPQVCNRNDRPKRFWSFMKNLRRDSSGVSRLSENGILKTGNKDKADIFSRRFGSV